MNKIACGLVCFGRKLVVFGGFGISPRSVQPESEFIPSRSAFQPDNLAGPMNFTSMTWKLVNDVK